MWSKANKKKTSTWTHLVTGFLRIACLCLSINGSLNIIWDYNFWRYSGQNPENIPVIFISWKIVFQFSSSLKLRYEWDSNGNIVGGIPNIPQHLPNNVK